MKKETQNFLADLKEKTSPAGKERVKNKIDFIYDFSTIMLNSTKKLNNEFNSIYIIACMNQSISVFNKQLSDTRESIKQSRKRIAKNETEIQVKKMKFLTMTKKDQTKKENVDELNNYIQHRESAIHTENDFIENQKIVIKKLSGTVQAFSKVIYKMTMYNSEKYALLYKGITECKDKPAELNHYIESFLHSFGLNSNNYNENLKSYILLNLGVSFSSKYKRTTKQFQNLSFSSMVDFTQALLLKLALVKNLVNIKDCTPYAEKLTNAVNDILETSYFIESKPYSKYERDELANALKTINVELNYNIVSDKELLQTFKKNVSEFKIIRYKI